MYKDKKIVLESANSKFETQEKAQRAIDSFKNEALKSVSKPIYQSGKTDTEKFNSQFEDVLTDLVKLFALANKTSAIIESNSSLYDEFIFNLKENLKKIENKIDEISSNINDLHSKKSNINKKINDLQQTKSKIYKFPLTPYIMSLEKGHQGLSTILA